MPGRRAVALVALVAAVAFGGGAALAATHGSSRPPVRRPPAADQQVRKQLPRAVHHCHLWNTSPGAASAASNL